MNSENSPLSDSVLENLISSKLMDLFLRVGFILFLVLECYFIFKPFMRIMLWSIILAVTLYPLHVLIAKRMGNKEGRAATVLVLAIMVGVLAPATLLAMSFADSIAGFVEQVRDGTFKVPSPPKYITDWPVVGDKLFALWTTAHNDIGAVLSKYEHKLLDITKEALGYATSAGTGMLKLLVSFAVAGIWMAYARPAHASARAIAQRMLGPDKGEALIWISTTTIRAAVQKPFSGP